MESFIGKTIDSYLILEVIGRDGIGLIFKAEDINLGKYVVLTKVDEAFIKDERFRKLIKKEANIIDKINIPGIIIEKNILENKQGFFLLMEYIEAQSLFQHIRENGPFSTKSAILIIKQLLNTIGNLHKVSIVHRDIKPINIYLNDNGEIKITYYALTSLIKKISFDSDFIYNVGSLFYTPPEVLKGLRIIGISRDIYSLGITFYEIITGRVPFEKTDSDFSIQKKIIEGKFPPPGKFNSNIPKKFEEIILKSINKNPNKRYRNTEDILNDIKKYEEELIEIKSGLRKNISKKIFYILKR